MAHLRSKRVPSSLTLPIHLSDGRPVGARVRCARPLQRTLPRNNCRKDCSRSWYRSRDDGADLPRRPADWYGLTACSSPSSHVYGVLPSELIVGCRDVPFLIVKTGKRYSSLKGLYENAGEEDRRQKRSSTSRIIAARGRQRQPPLALNT